VGPRAGLDGFGRFRLCRDSIPKQSSLLQVATPTELSQPTVIIIKVYKIRTILLSSMYGIAAHVVIKNYCNAEDASVKERIVDV
jgi:hypothetical protein